MSNCGMPEWEGGASAFQPRIKDHLQQRPDPEWPHFTPHRPFLVFCFIEYNPGV